MRQRHGTKKTWYTGVRQTKLRCLVKRMSVFMGLEWQIVILILEPSIYRLQVLTAVTVQSPSPRGEKKIDGGSATGTQVSCCSFYQFCNFYCFNAVVTVVVKNCNIHNFNVSLIMTCKLHFVIIQCTNSNQIVKTEFQVYTIQSLFEGFGIKSSFNFEFYKLNIKQYHLLLFIFLIITCSKSMNDHLTIYISIGSKSRYFNKLVLLFLVQGKYMQMILKINLYESSMINHTLHKVILKIRQLWQLD